MGSESLSEVHSSVKTDISGWRKFFAFSGPAFLISVGYMDPGNWATDIAGGSEFGYKLIWVLLMSNIMAILLQSLAVRLGIAGGMDLAQASKNAYPKWANAPLYILAEIAIAACDLAEIIGMAIGLNLLTGLPLIWGISLTALDTFLLLFLMNKGIRIMEAFIVSMVSIIGLSFLVEMLIVAPVYADVARGLIPSNLNGESLYITIGIIGATIMPHNLYLHSSLVQTRKFERSSGGIRKALRLNLFDTTIALNLAFFVNAAILTLSAAAFYINGYYNVAEIQDASKLLQNLFGNAAPSLFAIALIASGQSSTITGTLAGQIVMEGHLNLRIQPWIRRLITRMMAIIPAILTVIFLGTEALGKLLILSQVILSFQLGFAVIPLIHLTSAKELMKEFAIKKFAKIASWTSAAIIVALNVHLVYDKIIEWIKTSGEFRLFIYIFFIPFVSLCLSLLLFILIYPFLIKMKKIQPSTAPSSEIMPHGRAIELTPEYLIEYKHVAVAIDFSGKDQKIINSALKQGGKNASYTFIHVVESAAARYWGKKALDYETQLDRESLLQYQKKLETLGFKANYVLGFGNVAKELSKIILSNDYDLLVMGAHGHKKIKDAILGTTVDTVRHKIKIPLLIVY